jgi:hypothetical protein
MCSYRHSGDDGKFRDWAAQHRTELLGMDVPLSLWESESRWVYFLEHGHVPATAAAPAFDVDELDEAQVEKLLRLVETYVGRDDNTCQALRCLRTRVSKSRVTKKGSE